MRQLIDRKVMISMIFIMLTMLGVVSYDKLDMELFPNAEPAVLYIQAAISSEVEPEYIESEAAIPLEGAVGQLEGVEEISTSITSKRATVTVELRSDADVNFAYLKLEELVNELRSSISEDFTIQVNKVNTEQLSNQFMELQILGVGGVDRVRTYTDEEVLPELESIDGVASVKLYGGREKSVEVQLNKEACEAYNITPATVRSIITQNYESRSYAGNVKSKSEQLFVHVTSEFSSTKEIENLVVAEGPVLLKDIASVYFGVKDETSYSRVNSKDAVTMILMNDAQANVIDLSHSVRETIALLNEELAPLEMSISIQSDSAETMENNINEIVELSLVGAILALFILWIFLRKLKLISIIALAIPISIYSAFNCFYYFGVTINSLTLIGMALAVGMLLDNSVVVLENIYRLKAKGMSNRDAVVQGTSEVWRSIFAATLTTITVFVPFLFAEDFIVQLIGKQIGVSIISTLTLSLAVALLLIPMGAHYILGKSKSEDSFYKQTDTNSKIIQSYVTLLKASMRSPLRTVLGALILFFITLFGVISISVNSLDEVETDSFKVYVSADTGSTLEMSDEIVKGIETKLLTLQEEYGIEDVVSHVEADESVLTINMKEDFRGDYDTSLTEVKALAESLIGEVSKAEVTIDEAPTSSDSYGGGNRSGGNASMLKMMGVGSSSERIIIRGSDFEVMKNVSSDLEYYLDEMECIQSARVSISSDQPELHMFLDDISMNEYGITRQNVSTELNSSSREISTNIPFKEGLNEYDITIINQTEEEIIKEEETGEKDKSTFHELKALEISTSSGTTESLDRVARFVFSSGISRISRVNQEKQIEVTYSFLSEAQDSKTILEGYRIEIDELVAGYSLPSGVAIQVIHEEDDLDEFYYLIAAAFLLIFMILASVFESFTTPIVLMFTIPLAGIGSLLALLFSGNGIEDTNTLMGFLILLGVVVNNGIILIDYANILTGKGWRLSRALIVAGLSRVRPILITAITTIVAMLPLAMGDNEYVGAIGAPFAITVIGGLSVSTILTLIFIPTLYFGLENALKWVKALPLGIRVAQLIALIGGFIAIYLKVDDVTYQIIDTILLVVLVPGVTWFILNSLRMAASEVIDPNEPISIKIQQLVKIYDRPNKLAREFEGNERLRKLRGVDKDYYGVKDFVEYIWKIPLLLFLAYFTLIYLYSGLWTLICGVILFFMVKEMWTPFTKMAKHDDAGRALKIIARSGAWLIKWIYPLAFAIFFNFKIENPAVAAMLVVVWYLILYIDIIATRLHRDSVNVERLEGRFKGFRRSVYIAVKAIPIVGKKTIPFRALNGVSMEIKSGMFGLLGPNGAGKSTMMRIICGVYEQSYGKIWINGIDTQEKREELQGLIGYLPQEFGTYNSMSAWEFLDYQAILKGITEPKLRHERVEYVMNAVHLWDRRKESIGGYSGGMRQRIGIAQILLHLPRILVVDEPTAGLDPRERIRFRNLLVELSKDRIVIFSTHVIEDISSSCNQVAVINKGGLEYFGHPSDMSKLAEGMVWQFTIPASDFEAMPNKERVINHMRDGDIIKVRFISEEKPAEDAVMVTPILEEAYLCLLKGMKVK